jgi:16S rRNA (cytidine1402-2'-O)-methyltransferase
MGVMAGATDGGAGTLVLCSTPIGNVDDAPPRLAHVLAAADVVAAEDTRRLRRLTSHLGVRPAAVVSLFEGNERARTSDLLARLTAGATVALVTDAGTPTVSDPGYRLVAAAAEAGVRVTVVPGPSAVTAALAVAGLPTDRWCMEGFLPRRAGERRSRLAELATERRTLVLLEAPHRLPAMLADLAAGFGADRPAVVCRELTKTYEEVRRGTLAELADWAAGGVRGECTVVVAGATASTPVVERDLAALVAIEVAAGLTRKEAITAVARTTGAPRRAVYDAVVAAKASG